MIEASSERALLWQAIRQLPARQRAVIVLRFYEDLTYAGSGRVDTSGCVSASRVRSPSG